MLAMFVQRAEAEFQRLEVLAEEQEEVAAYSQKEAAIDKWLEDSLALISNSDPQSNDLLSLPSTQPELNVEYDEVVSCVSQPEFNSSQLLLELKGDSDSQLANHRDVLPNVEPVAQQYNPSVPKNGAKKKQKK